MFFVTKKTLSKKKRFFASLPTRHISELKYPPTHGKFPSFLEMDKTAGANSLQIYDYFSQIQPETKAFLLIVRHNTEGPPISDWQ